MIIDKWNELEGNVSYSETKILSDLEDSLTALGISISSSLPELKIAIMALNVKYGTKILYYQHINRYILTPKIYKLAPNYASEHLPYAPNYGIHIGGGFGGGGATSNY